MQQNLMVCIESDEEIHFDIEVNDDIDKGPISRKENVYSVLDESICCEVEEYKVIHVDNMDDVCSVLDESIRCEVEEYKAIHIDNKDEVCSVLDESIRCEVEEYKVIHVDNKDEVKLSVTKALNRSLNGMELNEHLSDMTKVYKRFGKKFVSFYLSLKNIKTTFSYGEHS
nr:uncharacterized protein LOC124819075 [Hydra vulgaris]